MAWNSPICYVEHLKDGQWLFYCYIIAGAARPGRYGWGTAGNAWAWADRVVRDDPNHWRIVGGEYRNG